MVPHDVLDVSVICNCGISSSLVFEILWFLMVYWMCLWTGIVIGIWDSVVPHGRLNGSVNCNCGITSSLVFEILWFLMVYWSCLWTGIVALPRHWYLRLCGSSWCKGCVCELELSHYLVIGIWDSVLPHGRLNGSVNWNCGITSSLVFEILWFLMVDWMGLWSVIEVLLRHW